MAVIIPMSGWTSSATSWISPGTLAPSSAMKTSLSLSSSLLMIFESPIGVLKDDGVFLTLRPSDKIVSEINLTEVFPKDPVIPRTFRPSSSLNFLIFA